MKIDRYTKALLTVIATCLVWSTVRDLLSARQAAAAPTDQRVVIVGVAVPNSDFNPQGGTHDYLLVKTK